MQCDRRAAIAGLAIIGSGIASLARAAQPLEGEYWGTLQVGGAGLRLRLVIGVETAGLYSLDQGNAAILASKVTRSGQGILIEFATIGARYEAVPTATGLDGIFTQGAALPLRMERGAPPASVDPLAGLIDGTLDQARLARIRTALGTPAMGLSWQRKGASATILVDGTRAAGSPARVTPADRWHLGSITKSFTATLFARMVEAGAVRWDTTIDAVLGKTLGPIPAAYSGLTARELLSHMAGLPANIALEDLTKFPRFSADSRADRLAYAKLALAAPPVAPRRTKMVYSNSGYVLAAAMLEVLADKPWEQLVKQQVLGPLGLRSAGFGPPGSAALVDQPRGHAIAPDGTRAPVWLDNPAVLGPAGRLHMCLPDVLTYLAAHRDRPKALLTTENWDMLHQPPFGGSYALGWVIRPDGTVWHNGSNTAWYAEAAFDRASGLLTASTANDTALANRPAVLLPAIRRSAAARV